MNVLDLFSGIGGFALGLESVGMRTVGFCEIEPFPRAVLAHHWPGVPIHDDVRTLSVESVPWLRAEAERGIDIICGGFPCQDISVAGKGAGLEGARSGLWREYARLVAELRPRWVLAENVGALRTRGVDRVCADLEAEGYAVWPLLVGAWAVGAPHRRERVWIVARLDDSDAGRRWRALDALQAGRDEPVAADVADRDERRLQGERDEDGHTTRDEHGIAWGHFADGRGERPVGNAERGGQQAGEPQRPGSGPALPSSAPGLPDAEGERRPQQGHGRHAGSRLGCDGPRWPARPGEQQHEWEEPRLAYAKGDLRQPHAGSTRAESREGARAAPGGTVREGLRSADDGRSTDSGPRSAQLPMGGTAHGLPERLARRANREALKALGNSVVPQVVATIGRAILAAEAEVTP